VNHLHQPGTNNQTSVREERQDVGAGACGYTKNWGKASIYVKGNNYIAYGKKFDARDDGTGKRGTRPISLYREGKRGSLGDSPKIRTTYCAISGTKPGYFAWETKRKRRYANGIAKLGSKREGQKGGRIHITRRKGGTEKASYANRSISRVGGGQKSLPWLFPGGTNREIGQSFELG